MQNKLNEILELEQRKLIEEYHIDFPNYTPSELIEITDLVLTEKNYAISAHTRRMLHCALRRLRFLDGNARDIRVIIEKAILEGAERLSQHSPDALSREELRTLELSDFTLVLRHLGKERQSKVATSFFGSPLFTIPVTHGLKFAGRVVGSKLSGERIKRKDALALASEVAISTGTELIMNSLKKQTQRNKSY